MQKLINVVALLSGLTSLGVIGGSAYLYIQKDVLIQQGIDTLSAGAIEAISGAVPDILDSAMPELPKATGGAIPGVPPTKTVTTTTSGPLPMP